MYNIILKMLVSSFLPKVGSVLTLIKQHWKVLLGLLALSALCFYIYSLNNKIEKLQSVNTKLVEQHSILVERCNANRLSLEQAIELQNSKIEDLNSNLKDKAEKLNELLKKNQQMQQEHEQELIEIYQEEKPKTCEESIKFLIDSKEDLTW